MSSSTGRPRKACSTCKGQKIRCTGERPICKRCLRLNHTCIYNSNPPTVRNNARQQQVSDSVVTNRCPSPTPTAAGEGRPISRSETAQAANNPVYTPALLHRHPVEERYLGIPKSLVLTLVEVYYDNVYNANLLLHKRLFLDSLSVGTARPHVVLSVCAWAANFYRDPNGQATLKEHGFMIEWAQRAGGLVFSEIENLSEDNIVTFCNLTLFWHSQGSWRICNLHKGNAYNLLHIIGLGSEALRSKNSWKSEIRRRHFWACYLMHCHNGDSLLLFEPVADMKSLALPWPDEDFNAGTSQTRQIALESGESNGGIFPELIKILTLWASVLTYIKTSESSLSVRVPAIFQLDEKLSDWWRKLHPDFKLTASSITSVPPDALPKILLMNIVYHQSLCAVHASIVPLFCWGEGDETWLTARQVSAQVAYEHASAASVLIDAVLSTFDRLSAMPSFISYAAYCGCAIQIPFMWSPNPAVKERARANVMANVKMIHTIAVYWKIAELLKVYVRCLYDGHKRHPTTLENEPKHIDPRKLTSFKVNAAHVQAPILDFNGILRSRENGYVRPGEEVDLGIENDSAGSESQSQPSIPNNHGDASSVSTEHHLQRSSQHVHSRPSGTVPFSPIQEEHYLQEQQQDPYSSTLAYQQSVSLATESQPLDMFHPFFDPEMLELFPNGELPDLSLFETSQLNLDYFDLEA